MNKEMGKMPSPKGNQKQVQIGLRINQDDGNQLQQIAKQAEVTSSEMVLQATKALIQDPPLWVRSKWKPQELNGQKIQFCLIYPDKHFEGIGELQSRGKPNGEMTVTIVLDEYWPPDKGGRTFMHLPQSVLDKMKVSNDARFKFMLSGE